VVSQADGEGLVYSLCELSARCIAAALFLGWRVRQRGLSLGAQGPPDESALYFALVPTRLLRLVKFLWLWVFRPHGPP
jgi:hypothetical protein